MDPATEYQSLDEPGRSNHLWRYTPWRRVHPTGDVSGIPEMGSPVVGLIGFDGGPAPDGISIQQGIVSDTIMPGSDALTGSFLRAVAAGSSWTLRVESGFSSEHPIILDVDVGDSASVLHLCLDVGGLSELELVTRVRGSGEWFGMLRTGGVGDGGSLNDVVVSLMDKGTLLRVDSINVGRDAQVRAGTAVSYTHLTLPTILLV